MQQSSSGKQTSMLAIVGLVLAILGWIPMCGLGLGLLGAIFGIIATIRIARDPAIGGRGLAIAAICLGFLGQIFGIAVLAAIAVPNFLEAQTRSRVSMVRSHMRSLATALETYYIDVNSYPAMSSDPRTSIFGNAQASLPVPGFRMQAGSRVMTLTTPVAYITNLPEDPFSTVAGGTYAYYTPGPRGFILISPGPDGDWDLDPAIYDPTIAQPSDDLLHFTWDPTNGTVSDGDIWRVKD